MTWARSSQRFRERSGFQCASDRHRCSAAVSPLRRSACGGEVLDAGPVVPTGGRLCIAPASFGAPLLRGKRIPGKYLSSCWPRTSDCIFRPKRYRCINVFRKSPYIVYKRYRETSHLSLLRGPAARQFDTQTVCPD